MFYFSQVKWGDKYGGYGEHYWDYNHADKSYDHGHGHGGHHGGHGHDDVRVDFSKNLCNGL